MSAAMPATAARRPGSRTGGWTWRGTWRWTWRGTCRRTRRMRSGSAVMMRRRTVDDRTRMMPTRRRRNRMPCVHNDVLNHDSPLRWLDAGAVAVRADGRPVGMRQDPHAVANRAKRTVDVITVDPCPGRHAAGCENERRRRQNRQDVLVHVTPRFLVYRELGGQTERF